MSNQHYTQCPNCKAIYPIPSTKLNDTKARAKCGSCQQIFLLNDNRVAHVPVAISVDTPKPSPAPTIQNKKENQTASNIGIDDDNPMIFDGADDHDTPKVADVRFSDDELSDFLNKEIKVAEDVIQAAHNEKEDESWLQDLLKDSDPSELAKQVKIDNTKVNEIDLVTIIPSAAHTPKIHKKSSALNKIFSNKPTSQQIATKKPIGVQIMWFIGCIILLLLLGVQYTIFNLDTLVRNPNYASSVQKFCNIAKCSIPNADLASISVSSTLKNHPKATDIIITIHNKSNHEQLYPNLLVRLKNKDGMVIADFVASSHSYLSESQTSILGNQSKRIMLTANTDKTPTSVEVTPFY